ncbi:hypothetical protein BKA61DRAFT_736806 [Leptodontidium sp. MPI-SDFR-AT-0119]|nr:hypothetical protein BKA61DRAFT_736806 [Leptodontidium sp. MPI-SDFR-AT-0119]
MVRYLRVLSYPYHYLAFQMDGRVAKYPHSIQFMRSGSGSINSALDRGRYCAANFTILVIVDVGPRFPDKKIPWSGPGERLETFTLFPKLPLELRNMIWIFAATEARMITFHTREKSAVDGKLETFRGENADRHRAMGVAPPGFEPEERSVDQTNNSGKLSVARNTTTEQTLVGAKSKDKHALIDAAITRFRSNTKEGDYLTENQPLSVPQVLSRKKPLSTIPPFTNSTSPESASSLNTLRQVASKNLPAILQVNNESRTKGLKYFKLSLHNQRDGRPVYINYSKDEFRVRNRKGLESLCGIETHADRMKHQRREISNRRTPGLVDDKERTDPESMLCFLNIDYNVQVRVNTLITRFHNLELLTLKELHRMENCRPVGTRQAYENLGMGEELLKTSWKKDDEDRGVGCEPNKIPVFKFLGETTSTAGSDQGTLQVASQASSVFSPVASQAASVPFQAGPQAGSLLFYLVTTPYPRTP